MKKIIILSGIVIACLTGLSIAVQLFPRTFSFLKPDQTEIVTPKPHLGESSVEGKIQPGELLTPKPIEILPAASLVGGKYPFCGETDVIVAFKDPTDAEGLFYIPSCYQIFIFLSRTNLIVYEVLEEVDGWLKIRMNPQDQIYSEFEAPFKKREKKSKQKDETQSGGPAILDIGPVLPEGEEPYSLNNPPETAEETISWIKKSDAFTAWTIKEADNIFLLQTVNPEVTKNEDGTWSASSLGACDSESSTLLGNDSSVDGLKMNINYDHSRDCGT